MEIGKYQRGTDSVCQRDCTIPCPHNISFPNQKATLKCSSNQNFSYNSIESSLQFGIYYSDFKRFLVFNTEKVYQKGEDHLFSLDFSLK